MSAPNPRLLLGSLGLLFGSGDGRLSSDITLRDLFAAAALSIWTNSGGDFDPPQIAKAAYEQADAMLRERAK